MANTGVCGFRAPGRRKGYKAARRNPMFLMTMECYFWLRPRDFTRSRDPRPPSCRRDMCTSLDQFYCLKTSAHGQGGSQIFTQCIERCREYIGAIGGWLSLKGSG